MISEILQELNNYLCFLKQYHNLCITIHDRTGFTNRFYESLSEYSIHDNSYCLLVKSNAALWNKCIENQLLVSKRCNDKICFGMCYAGVEEFVLPVKDGKNTVAFICISGYRKNKIDAHCRIKILSERYKISYEKLIYYYENSLSADIPDITFVKQTASIVARLLHLIYIEVKKEGETDFAELSNKEYVYRHIIAYLEKNYAQNVSLKDISEFCHYSESYISHMFKERSGFSISNFVSNLRINKAKELLADTDIPIIEIAHCTGFNDSNYFSNVFKSNSGVTPREYRKFHTP